MDPYGPESSTAGWEVQADSLFWGSGFHRVPVRIIWQLENYKDDTCTTRILLIRVCYAHTKEVSGLFREEGIAEYPVVG